MRGPSSSHCAAALRIGRLARDLMEGEIAEVLGMSKAGAGSRYLRAIKRLKEILSQIPGFME